MIFGFFDPAFAIVFVGRGFAAVVYGFYVFARGIDYGIGDLSCGAVFDSVGFLCEDSQGIIEFVAVIRDFLDIFICGVRVMDGFAEASDCRGIGRKDLAVNLIFVP